MRNAGGAQCSVCGTPRPGGGGTAGGGGSGQAASEGAFTLEQLSETVWKVVEADRFGQFPFLYVIMGPSKCAVIDTGCDSDNYKAFLDKHVNPDGKPYVLVCTHVHFDHVGGNHRFAGTDIVMSDRAQAFSQNYQLTSLCSAHGARVHDFAVTQVRTNRKKKE